MKTELNKCDELKTRISSGERVAFCVLRFDGEQTSENVASSLETLRTNALEGGVSVCEYVVSSFVVPNVLADGVLTLEANASIYCVDDTAGTENEQNASVLSGLESLNKD